MILDLLPEFRRDRDARELWWLRPDIPTRLYERVLRDTDSAEQAKKAALTLHNSQRSHAQ